MTDEEKLGEKRKKQAEYQRKWREANREKRSAYRRKYNAENRDKKSAKDRERLYGLSQEQFDGMLKEQNFSCAICLTTDTGRRGTFFVDHCHTSGAVRGLLCQHCNTGLGNFRDNPTSLQRAVGYLAATAPTRIHDIELRAVTRAV